MSASAPQLTTPHGKHALSTGPKGAAPTEKELLDWNNFSEAMKKIEEACETFYTFDLAGAEEIVEPYIRTQPLASFLFGEIAFMRSVLDEDKRLLQVAFTRLEAAVALAERVLKRTGKFAPKNMDSEEAKRTCSMALAARLAQADSSLWNAVLKFKSEAHVKGAYHFRRAWKYLEKAEDFRKGMSTTEGVPFYKDIASGIDNGLGFFHFAVSIVPREWAWIIEAIGFTGDRALGLQELIRSAEADGSRSFAAYIHLTWINDFFFENYKEGEKWVERALGRYPLAAQIHYLAGYVYRKSGRIQDAKASFQKTYEFSGQLPVLRSMAEYDLAYNQMFELDFKTAMVSFEELIRRDPTLLRPYGYWQLAMCHEMLGDKKPAMRHMKYALSKCRKGFEYDEYAKIKAKKYTTKGITDFEREYFCASLLLEALDCKKGLELITKADAMRKDDEDRALSAYIKGAFHFHLGNFEEAEKLLDEAISLEKNIKNHAFIAPFSLTFLGEIRMKKDQNEEAKVLLNRAKGYQNYDFSQLHGWRIAHLLEVIENPAAYDILSLSKDDKAEAASSSS